MPSLVISVMDGNDHGKALAKPLWEGGRKSWKAGGQDSIRGLAPLPSGERYGNKKPTDCESVGYWWKKTIPRQRKIAMQLIVHPNMEFRFQASVTAGSPYLERKRATRERAKSRAEARRKAGGGASPPLVLSSQLSQPRQRKVSRGPFRRKAAARVRQIAGALSQIPLKQQVFVTVTLPGSTVDAMLEFSRLSGQFVKLLQTYVPRSVYLSAHDLQYCWVWEFQGRGALHLHAVIGCPSRKHARLLRWKFRRIAVQVLRAVAAKAKPGVDLFARRYGGSHRDRDDKWRVDAQIVERSASGYLAKYLSKGSADKPWFRPSRWYGASRSLRRASSSITSCLSSANNKLVADTSVIAAVRAAVIDVISPFLVAGEVRSTREKNPGKIDLMGFFRGNVGSSEVLSMIEDSCQDLIVPIPLSPMPEIDADILKGRIRRYVRAYNRCPYWFRERVRVNLPERYRGGVDWSLATVDEILDLRHTVASELFAMGYVGSAAGRPEWVTAMMQMPIIAASG